MTTKIKLLLKLLRIVKESFLNLKRYEVVQLLETQLQSSSQNYFFQNPKLKKFKCKLKKARRKQNLKMKSLRMSSMITLFKLKEFLHERILITYYLTRKKFQNLLNLQKSIYSKNQFCNLNMSLIILSTQQKLFTNQFE